MTRNQQLLLIMSWARSFHGLSPEELQRVAEDVLDNEFNGSIENVVPSEVIHAFDKHYFTLNTNGELVPDIEGNTPKWEDYGAVRPPSIQDNSFFISDYTTIDATGIAIAKNPVPDFPFNDTDIGVRSDGSLRLNSGGVIPPLDDEKRDIVWPMVFSDPTGYDQNKIDHLIENCPDVFVPQNYVEEKALEIYNSFSEMADQIDLSQYQQHGHPH